MSELTGRDLTRGKEEYTEAVVENMTTSQMRSYLYQIIYNDVAVLSSEDFAKKVRRQFGDDFYDELVEDIAGKSPTVHVRRELDAVWPYIETSSASINSLWTLTGPGLSHVLQHVLSLWQLLSTSRSSVTHWSLAFR